MRKSRKSGRAKRPFGFSRGTVSAAFCRSHSHSRTDPLARSRTPSPRDRGRRTRPGPRPSAHGLASAREAPGSSRPRSPVLGDAAQSRERALDEDRRGLLAATGREAPEQDQGADAGGEQRAPGQRARGNPVDPLNPFDPLPAATLVAEGLSDVDARSVPSRPRSPPLLSTPVPRILRRRSTSSTRTAAGRSTSAS